MCSEKAVGPRGLRRSVRLVRARTSIPIFGASALMRGSATVSENVDGELKKARERYRVGTGRRGVVRVARIAAAQLLNHGLAMVPGMWYREMKAFRRS